MPSERNSRAGGDDGAGKVWFAVGAWAGLLLALGRGGVIWVMEAGAHGGDVTLVGSRLLGLLPGILGLSFLVAWGGSTVLVLFRRRVLLRGLAALALAWAFANVLLGWWGADSSLQIGMDTTAGIVATGVVAVAALVLSVALGVLLLRADRAAVPLPRARVPLGLAVAATVALQFLTPGVAERMSIHRVERELFGVEDWELIASLPDAPPFASVLSPSLLPSRDGGDMPGLVLPPPARVRFTVGDDAAAGSRWLMARVGVDHSVVEEFGERLAGLSVEFQVVVDGRLAFEQAVPIVAESRWVDVGGAGIALPGHSVVELATRLVDAGGKTVAAPGPIHAGFGGIRIESRDSVPRTRSSPEQPNIVLIVMDTQRADRTSAFGYERATTPNLAALAARGIAFDNAHATSSWTWPSTASILTGLQNQEHGVTDARSCFLPRELETLPEALQAAGYSTAAWSANPLIVADKYFDQGFELFDATSTGGLRRSDTLVPAVLDWLELMSDWRFFLYLHLVDPHAPLTPLPEGRALFAPDVPVTFDPRSITEYGRALLAGEGHASDGTPATERVVPPEHQRWISDLYDACTWSGDLWIGRVLERLEQLGLLEQTIVVVTSDHGEELFDHGLAAHGHSLHGELTRVPLVLAGPGIDAGVRIRTPVSNRHLSPTLARLAGAEIDGLVPTVDLLRMGPGEAAPVFFSTTVGWWNGVHPQPLLGLRDGSLVVHVAPQGGAWNAEPDPGGQVRLFDLDTDPGERRDVAMEREEEAIGLRRRAEELARTFAQRRRVRRIEAGDTTLEQLRALGYVE